MPIAALLLLLSTLLPCVSLARREPGPRLGPLSFATAEGRAEFEQGRALFNHFYSAREGLGPVYSSNACVACHTQGGRGPIVIVKLTAMEEDGHTPAANQSAYLPWGPNVRPFTAYPAKVGVTEKNAMVAGEKILHASVRMPPPMFGRGYLEAVAEEEILRMEESQRARPDEIKGKANRILRAGEPVKIGRFGLKARIAELDGFTADAFVSDMGLTSDLRPVGFPNPENIPDSPAPEIAPEVIHQVSQFTRFLAVDPLPESSARGRKIFAKVECAVCHVPHLAVDPRSPLGLLGLKMAPLFSDLLLHDMGAALADGQTEESAGPRHWRTAPLLALRYQQAFLHDGRAATIEAAIGAHGAEGSEAAGAYRLYKALGPSDRRALLSFLRGL